jgi:hypothetical protein
MLKSYVHKSFISHALNQSIGVVLSFSFLLVVIRAPHLIGMKGQYDIFNVPCDTLSFISSFLILLLVIVQVVKSYLLYIPSTYITFNSSGMSFKMLKKEYKFLRWEDVLEIELAIESEWLLAILIKTGSGQVVKAELTQLWILSLTRKWGVCHNFLKLIAIANNNPNLKSKMLHEQIEKLNSYCGVVV